MRNVNKRLSLLEQAAKAAGGMALDYRRAEELTDEELVFIITEDPNIRPEDITDEDLERLMAGGEVAAWSVRPGGMVRASLALPCLWLV